jgi:hypothetical protein
MARRGEAAPQLKLLPDKIKRFCQEYHIDIELDKARQGYSHM